MSQTHPVVATMREPTQATAVVPKALDRVILRYAAMAGIPSEVYRGFLLRYAMARGSQSRQGVGPQSMEDGRMMAKKLKRPTNDRCACRKCRSALYRHEVQGGVCSYCKELQCRFLRRPR